MDDRPDEQQFDEQDAAPAVIDLRDGADSFEERLAEIEAMLDALGIPG